MAGRRERGKLTHQFHYVWGEDSGGEGSTEDVRKLLVEAANAHLLKVPVGANDGRARLSCLGFSWRGSDRKRQPHVGYLLKKHLHLLSCVEQLFIDTSETAAGVILSRK